MNKPLLKSMTIAAIGSMAIGKAERKIADHKIGVNQSVMRWTAVIASAVLLELLVTSAEKAFGLTEENGQLQHLFQK